MSTVYGTANESVTKATAQKNGEVVTWSRGRQPYRKGRRHPCNRDLITIRRQQQNTHRQMDNVWLAEMVDTNHNDSMSAEVLLDISLDWDEPRITLEELEEAWFEAEDAERDYLLWYYENVPETKAHGFNGDPFDEPFPEPEYQFDPFSGHFYYGDEEEPWYEDRYGVLDDYGLEADQEQYWQELAEMEPSKEVWAAMDAEERQRETTAEAFEALFDHLAAGNAVGLRMQLTIRRS